MGAIASQITILTIVYSIVYSDADQQKRHWPLYGEFSGTGEFPAKMASNAENVSIWWRHHDKLENCHWADLYRRLPCQIMLVSGNFSMIGLDRVRGMTIHARRYSYNFEGWSIFPWSKWQRQIAMFINFCILLLRVSNSESLVIVYGNIWNWLPYILLSKDASMIFLNGVRNYNDMITNQGLTQFRSFYRFLWVGLNP